MPSIPIQAAVRQKTPFDGVIEQNLATLSDEERREFQSDQNGEITEALQLLCKTDSIHCKQSRLRQLNHKLTKYTAWLPTILDVLSDPIAMSFPGSGIATGIVKAIANVCITTLLNKSKALSQCSLPLKSLGRIQVCPIRSNYFAMVSTIFHATTRIRSPGTRNIFGSSLHAYMRIY
jgi:hypothetical protein